MNTVSTFVNESSKLRTLLKNRSHLFELEAGPAPVPAGVLPVENLPEMLSIILGKIGMIGRGDGFMSAYGPLFFFLKKKSTSKQP